MGAWLDRLGRRKRIERAHIAAELPDTRVVEVDGALLRVRDTGGSSAAVILVPDPPNIIEHYDQLFEHLQQHFRVICFDAPGFGFSVVPPKFGFSVEEYADVSAALLRLLEVDAPVWAASCLPAYIGLTVASRHSGLLSGLVCGQAPSWEQELLWARRIDRKRILSTPGIGQLLVAGSKRRIAAGWYGVTSMPRDKEWLARVAIQGLNNGGMYSLASVFQNFFAEASQPKPVDLPGCFVWGDLDRTHRRTDRSSVLNHLTAPSIVTFPGSAHFPDLEQPDRFAGVIGEVASASRSLSQDGDAS